MGRYCTGGLKGTRTNLRAGRAKTWSFVPHQRTRAHFTGRSFEGIVFHFLDPSGLPITGHHAPPILLEAQVPGQQQTEPSEARTLRALPSN